MSQKISSSIIQEGRYKLVFEKKQVVDYHNFVVG